MKINRRNFLWATFGTGTAIAKQLDPTIPCYITGHSLGAAVATLVAREKK